MTVETSASRRLPGPALVAAALVVTLASPVAQDAGRRQSPPRDTRAVANETAIIRGRVVDAESGMPLRRAQVRLSAEGEFRGRIASTDAEGRYELRELPAGRYSVSAAKGAYVTISYGQRRPYERGTLVELAAGQVLERIDLALPRGAVIQGRVYDEFGEPVAGARVQPFRFRYSRGERRLLPGGRPAMTDDRGDYRLFGLSPGDYFVTATLPSFTGDSDERSSYAPTYYPGTATPSHAQTVRLTVGQEATASFALMLVDTVRVSGLAISSSGGPLTSGAAFLRPATTGAEPLMMSFRDPNARIQPDGSFQIRNVAPGDYTLEIRSDGDDERGEFASAPVAIGGEDVAGLVIRTGPGATATGTVVFEPAAPTGVRADVLRVHAPAIDPAARGRGGRGEVRDDWTFMLTGLSGRRLLRVDQLPAGWWLKAVWLGEQDVTDVPIDFSRTGSIEGLRIVLTDQTSRVTGVVNDAAGKPTREYVAVVFAEDPLKWRVPSRFVGVGRPDQQGRFEIRGLPPERYLGVAVDYLQMGEEEDPEFLDQMRALGTGVSIAEGQEVGVALKLLRRPY